MIWLFSEKSWKQEIKIQASYAYDDGFSNGVSQGISQGIEAMILDNLEENVPAERILEKIQKHFHLTREEAKELRFMRWDEDMPDLYLIPLWLLPVVPIGTELTSIGGEKVIYDGTNVDNDIRFGCIAYGIEIKE